MKKIKHLIFEGLSYGEKRGIGQNRKEKSEIKKILLIRQDNRIGNIIFITSLIELIKSEFGIKVDVVLGEKFNTILDSNPNIDNILIYSQKKFLKNPLYFFKFIRKLKNTEYDLIIDCKNAFSFNNALITLLANGKIKIGFKNIYSERYLDYAVDTEKITGVHESEYLAVPLKEYFGITAKTPAMRYFLKEQLEKPLKKDGVKEIGIHIGGRGGKSLPISFIKSLLDLNDDKTKIKIIYGPDEVEKLKLLNLEDKIESIYPQALEDLAQLIDSLELLITPDTGPLHIASALNQNIVAVFTEDSVLRYGPRTEKKSLCINLSKKSEEEAKLEIVEFIESI